MVPVEGQSSTLSPSHPSTPEGKIPISSWEWLVGSALKGLEA